MYVYTPVDNRSLVVNEYIISSTGLESDVAIPCLEEVVGTLLTREHSHTEEPAVDNLESYEEFEDAAEI